MDGGIGMIGTKPVYNAIMGCDLLLMVGTDYPYSNFLPSKGTVIQIDERPQVLGRRAPTVLGVTGSARPTLKLLLDEVASKTNTYFWDRVTEERQKWDEMLDSRPTSREARIASIRRRWPGGQRSRQARCDIRFRHGSQHALVRQLDPAKWSAADYRFLQQRAVGTALAQANGIQALDRSRQVIALCGDGGFNMLMGEFLTAVHHKLPIKVVIYNNSAFGLITLEAESVGLPPFREGIEFPNPDFAALARACGGHGLLPVNR